MERAFGGTSGATRSGALRARGRSRIVLAALVAAVVARQGASADVGPAEATPRAASSHVSAPAIPADATRVLFFLVRQRDDLGDLALAVSDPASPSYGRHRPVEAIAAQYGASREVIARVASFLEGYGVEGEVDVAGTFFAALLDPRQVTAIFGPDPPAFPPVPAELSGAVTGIVGAFPSGAAMAQRLPVPPRLGQPLEGNDVWPAWSMGSGTQAPCPDPDPDGCSNDFPNPGPPSAFRSFTPDQLRTAYGLSSTGLRSRGRSAVVIEFGQMVDPSDVAAYADGLGRPRPPLHQVVVDDRGTQIPVGTEATLDVETIVGLAPGLERLTLLTADVETDAEFYTYWPMILSRALDRAMTGGRLPDVISSSYGVACEHDLPEAVLIDASETIFQTAAAAGVTISAAAGDRGSTSCVPRTPPYTERFLALAYPGSSPWVTSVGGTSLPGARQHDRRRGDAERLAAAARPAGAARRVHDAALPRGASVGRRGRTQRGLRATCLAGRPRC